MKTLSKILKNKRKELKLSLRKSAELIGISHSYLNNLEKGIDPRTKTFNKPTPETLKLISDAYKIDYNELMIASGYVTPSDISAEVYKPNNIDEDIEANLNHYRSHQFASMLLELNPKNQKRIIEWVKLLKLLEDNNLDIKE